MATLKKNQNPTSYTYESVDGSTSTIEVGKDGVTKEMIVLLQQDDNRCYLQDLYQMRHESYKFQNAMAKYCRSGDENAENPFYQIEDPAADISRILFPEEADDPEMLERLCKAIEQLTDNQKDMIHELYGLRKPHVEIAREQNVTPVAIRNRRDKILKRLAKLLDLPED